MSNKKPFWETGHNPITMKREAKTLLDNSPNGNYEDFLKYQGTSEIKTNGINNVKLSNVISVITNNIIKYF
jgi:hypothetical protein